LNSTFLCPPLFFFKFFFFIIPILRTGYQKL
jgi:hypothetical protein